MREIERKFLLSSAPDVPPDAQTRHLHQGYLAIEESGEAEVRLRRSDARTILGVKLGRGRSRDEVEVTLEQGAFDALWPLTANRRVEKTRREWTRGQTVFSVDIYSGTHAGLAVVEVEFATEEACRRFEPPPWFGREVTEDGRYANQQLALAGRLPE